MVSARSTTSRSTSTPLTCSPTAHLKGRRRRFKVRTRTYLNSGLCMFEVKTEGARENTVKDRIEHPLTRRGALTLEAYTFLSQTLREALGQQIPEGLRPVVINLYRRTTFASPSAGARLTCDVSVSCHNGRASVSDTGTHVLVESRSANGASKADLILRRLGVRPASISKYCIGVAALYPEVPCNPWQASLLRYFEAPWLAGPSSTAACPPGTDAVPFNAREPRSTTRRSARDRQPSARCPDFEIASRRVNEHQ